MSWLFDNSVANKSKEKLEQQLFPVEYAEYHSALAAQLLVVTQIARNSVGVRHFGGLYDWIDQLAQAGQTAVEADISHERLLAADEVWLCNSLLGLAPVAAIGQQTWSSWPQGRYWQQVYEHFLVSSSTMLSPR